MDRAQAVTAGLTKWDHGQAKARFAELLRRARTEGPQLVTTRGAMPVVVISADDYGALVDRRTASFRDLLLPGDGFAPERAALTATDEPFSL